MPSSYYQKIKKNIYMALLLFKKGPYTKKRIGLNTACGS